jgi:hypothetical protein
MLGWAVAGAGGTADVNTPRAFTMLLRSESRQASIVPVGGSWDADERSRRSFHRLWLWSSGLTPAPTLTGGPDHSGGCGLGDSAAGGVVIQGTSSPPDPLRLK